MKSKEPKSRFVLMPGTNMWNADEVSTSLSFLRSVRRSIAISPRPQSRQVSSGKTPTKRPDLDITVLDEVAPEESLLVALSDVEVVELAKNQPSLRIVPVVELKPLWLRSLHLRAPAVPAAARRRISLKVTVVTGDSGVPCPGVTVYGFTDRANETGVQNVTDENGIAKLVLPVGIEEFEVVEVEAPSGYWSPCARRVKLATGELTLRCPAIDLGKPDVRDYFALRGNTHDGTGVIVGVIDTGVATHPDLSVSKAVNVVAGEDPGNVDDAMGHGTHVSGIIAGRGAAGVGVCGVAPGVTLHVYKVFGTGQERAESFHIAKAIRMAVNDGCDLINISLGAAQDMPDVLREVQRARALGVVCLGATGNDFRAPVSYPAAYSQVLAVSALGRKGTYPRAVVQGLCAVPPYGTDAKNYVADFSNVGAQVALTGPGVGIVSSVGSGVAVMDGTSMACPVATGAIARLLATNAKILAMDRTQKRSDSIIKLALSKASSLGLGAHFEGAGCLM
jgi:subtilisin family serine protease